ncbi:MAG: hypothetical protein QOH41_4247 [Blastocatellia bacterium]|nr:hypothetical protein [Blastocatellia bacterium]
MLRIRNSRNASAFALALGLLLISACKPMSESNANSNVNANANTNSSAGANNLNANSESANSGPTINTREPDKYSATLTFSLETEGGDKAIGIPSLAVQVARNGDDRRVEFKLPDGSPLVYLDHNNRHYVILPARKQYAELTQESTGVQFHKLITPGQLVEDLKKLKGVERVGDGPINGRDAEKYRYSTSTNTNTKVGEVKAEAFVYVDKETGLPLRAEMLAESSGDVKGVKAARVVSEMRDIKTDVAPTLFEPPAGYEQVAPEKVRQQIDALTSAVASILKAMMASAVSSSSPTPAASVKP